MKVITRLLVALALVVPVAAPALADAGNAGSIAFSPSTGKIGSSWGYDTKWAAERAAISACGVGDCTWQVEERGEYAALAQGSNGLATAWNRDPNTAVHDALASCSARSSDCRIIATVNN